MKLFARRKRKVADPKDAEQMRQQMRQEQDSTQSEAVRQETDLAIQELLKRDPSEINARQRRMLKRYRTRAGYDDYTCTADPSNEPTGDDGLPVSSAVEIETPTVSDEKISDSRGLDADVEVDNDACEAPSGGAQIDEAHVRNVLENLNSKQRRKLSRKLDREGSTVLSEVLQEAVTLMETETSTTKKNLDGEEPFPSATNQNDDDRTTGKKRKRKPGWSALPPEERLRREEQRRLQQEAAEKRLKEGVLPNGVDRRHPLNSERRRANRRKPKWQRKVKTDLDVNDHHESGFHMRKIQKQTNWTCPAS